MVKAEPPGGEAIRKAELIAAISRATELAMGQPADFALQSCVLGVALARDMSLGPEHTREVFYQALLRYIGCNAENYATTALFADEIALRQAIAPVDMAKPSELLPVIFRLIAEANASSPPVQRIWNILRSFGASRSVSMDVLSGHCEVAARFGVRLGFPARIVDNLGQLYARWDGRGIPQGLRGEAIAPAVRIVVLVQDALVLNETYGLERCLATLRRRRGKAYDPAMVDAFVPNAEAAFASLAAHTSWQSVLTLEPEPYTTLASGQVDSLFLALADFIDIKSPFTSGHSRAVAALAAEAARRYGLQDDDVRLLHQAGLVHDIGLAGVTTAILVKAAPLSDSEWEKVRLHPYYAERILAQPPLFAALAPIVARHHERIDGSGYHRAVRGDALTPHAKILAVAEAYQAMIEPRPHRAALTPNAAALAVNQDVRAGRFDGQAAAAVLAAAGHRGSQARPNLIAGLTSRETEVLRLIGRGRAIKEIARELGIAPKTADNHVQNLYAKIGVRTRAGATLFAIEHGLYDLSGD